MTEREAWITEGRAEFRGTLARALNRIDPEHDHLVSDDSVVDSIWYDSCDRLQLVRCEIEDESVVGFAFDAWEAIARQADPESWLGRTLRQLAPAYREA